MTWRIAAVAVIAAVALASGARAQTEEVTIATGDWPPYCGSSLAEGGLHARKVRAAFAKSGISVVFDFLPWKRAWEELKSGQALATFSWVATPERAAESIVPSRAIDRIRNVVFYRKSAYPNGLNPVDLKDLVAAKPRLVGIGGYWYEKPLKELGADLYIVHGTDLAWRHLDADKADAVLSAELVGQYQIAAVLGGERGKAFGQSTTALRDDVVHILFTKANPNGERLRKIWDAYVEAGVTN